MPIGRWPEFETLLSQFEAARNRSIEFTTATDADLRNHVFPHPFLGQLDCYQWLLFIAAHCERHVRQMEEVLVGQVGNLPPISDRPSQTFLIPKQAD